MYTKGDKILIQRNSVILAFLLSFGIIGIFFQNCTTAVPFGNENYYSKLVSSSVFPYEVGFDQVAYLSCSEQGNIQSDGEGTFFTFRVGSYRNMGIRITQEYRDQIEKITEQNIINALNESQMGSGLNLQFAIRSLDNLQTIYVDQKNGSEGIEGSDYQNFFPQTGDEDLSNILWYLDPDLYLRNYSSGLRAREYRFEGHLKFMTSQNMERSLRSFFSNRGAITLTFAKFGENKPVGPGHFIALQDEDQKNDSDLNNIRQNVFGMAVRPRFKQPDIPGGGSPGPDMPPRVMGSVTEHIIDRRKTISNVGVWECPGDMQFMIVLPEDATYRELDLNFKPTGDEIIRCAMKPDPIQPGPRLQIIRQSLYSEDWYVDLDRSCVVPKAGFVVPGTCYGLNSKTRETHKIHYEVFDSSKKECGFQSDLGLCPHYASVCYRK